MHISTVKFPAALLSFLGNPSLIKPTQ